ncbi:hypothetical protein EW026_g7817 [Hermanssonia centrifuga]|uniref:Kri1-like C-terminal domain-containing protein n=1 Tax=Hermanssonia centrifuga TaxID=98765 RepID=A0A4S4K6K4_9APHY|nr:hypothetical protein EW026_g7817 [Hermanssonia centrifuga]
MLKKKEEIKRLKSLKMKEIREKLERVGREGGKTLAETAGSFTNLYQAHIATVTHKLTLIALQELDLEGDWDPDAHDKQMTDIYGQDSEDAFNNDEKPQWDDDIDVTDIVHEEAESSEKKKKKKKKKKGGDEGVDESGVNVDEMDADVEMAVDEEEWDGTEEMRKRKLDEYMDEIYGLDFNDMVGGMPTRFKYTKVQQQAYALSPVEILLATDAELNQYMGIKKYAPYRKDGNNWDQNRSTRLKELKTKLQERGVTSGVAGEASAGERPAKKRKGKKERMKAKEAVVQDGDEEGEDMGGGGAAMEADRSRDESKSEETKRNRHQEPVEEEIAAERDTL